MYGRLCQNARVILYLLYAQPIYKTTEVFTAGAWKHESAGRVLSGPQLGKPSDVRWIMSSHEGSFVFIIHPN